MLTDIFGFERADQRVRAEMARSMHARPIGLTLSCVCAIAAGSVTLATATLPFLQACGALLALVALLRLVVVFARLRLQGRLGGRLQATFPLFALVFAGAIGLATATALVTDTAPELQVLLVGYAMSVGAGVTVGNAGRPMIVLGQIVLVFVPIMIACLIRGSLPMVTLALIVPVLMVGMAWIAFNLFTVISRQVRSASESAELAAQLRDQACTDPVTALNSRTGFELHAGKLLADRKDGSLLALFWLDVRRFKEVNDMLGHQVGDEVLRIVAERLRKRTPEGAVLGRFGSDEFLLLSPFRQRRDVEALADVLGTDLAVPMRIAGQRIECGASIGVGLVDADSPDLDSLMQHAGLALYYAKASGQNQVCFFNQAMTRNLVRRKEIEADLRAAIQKDELSIYFQPIVDLATGRIRSFEALVRWFHPERGELAPQDFIPVAEDTGLIITLGNWITRTAARAAANWPEQVTLAVNLSPVQIHAPGAALGILAALREAQLPPSRLELEVTENLFVEDNEATALFMDMLAAEGVHFALDDFGTGYSSLHYINKYPFRTIKVDRSFVSGPHTGRKSDAIIRAVAEMGQTLGMEIVAEGLETSEQVDTVRRAGCTLGQGYHFSRAVPEHLAVRLLEDEREAELALRRVR